MALPAVPSMAPMGVPGMQGASPAMPGLAMQLAQLMSTADGAAAATPSATKRKPRLLLLLTRLSPEVPDSHLQQILEQCGEVQGFRRGRGLSGELLNFGMAQFEDPASAWRALTCINKQVLKGQEVRVLAEEATEQVIKTWRESQRVALKVNTPEELDWELEKQSVGCKALIDAKLEELYGTSEGHTAGKAETMRLEELRQRELIRIERVKKRKAWRDSQFQEELSKVEDVEKRRKLEEDRLDEEERAAEEAEQKERAEKEQQLERLKQESTQKHLALLEDNKALVELVDKVQAESRDDLFRMGLDVNFLRSERVLDLKLRPWLEKKIDLLMGGQQSDVVEWIIRKVHANAMPEAIINELSRYLDDSAEPLVERMWRMIGFELVRGGFLLPSDKKLAEAKEQAE